VILNHSASICGRPTVRFISALAAARIQRRFSQIFLPFFSCRLE
jgi:hypothetical protein